MGGKRSEVEEVGSTDVYPLFRKGQLMFPRFLENLVGGERSEGEEVG